MDTIESNPMENLMVSLSRVVCNLLAEVSEGAPALAGHARRSCKEIISSPYVSRSQDRLLSWQEHSCG